MKAAHLVPCPGIIIPCLLRICSNSVNPILYRVDAAVSSRRIVASVLVFFIFFTITLPAGAAEVAGLYEAAVTVDSRDDERQRLRAFSVAMREIVVKLTGNTESVNHPAITRAMTTPQEYVESWVYRTLEQDPEQEEQSGKIGLEVTFFKSGIDRLLNDAGIPVWPENRPATLLWVVVQDELGERFLAGSAAGGGNDILEQLESIADKRGLPLKLPLLDFSDQRNLRPDQLWNFDLEAIRNASTRYQGESILVLRIFRLLSGEVIGKAAYIFRNQMLQYDPLETTLPEFLAGSIDLAAEELAGYYAVLLSGTDNGTTVLLTVDGIRDVDDYASLLRYLGGLAAVSSVQVLTVDKASVQLELRTGGQFRQLIESIALGNTMMPLGSVSRDNQQVLMHYQWSAR